MMKDCKPGIAFSIVKQEGFRVVVRGLCDDLIASRRRIDHRNAVVQRCNQTALQTHIQRMRQRQTVRGNTYTHTYTKTQEQAMINVIYRIEREKYERRKRAGNNVLAQT